MAIDGKENHRIPLHAARGMIRRFRERPLVPRRVRGHAVSRGIIEEILGQPGCMGLRMYHALDETGAETLVIVGITADERDMTDGTLAEQTRPCPPYCSDRDLGAD